MIHSDPNPSNLIDTGEALGFIDFELCRRCVRLFDPCYLITAVLSEVFERDDLPWAANWPLMNRAVLEGYDSVSPLTEQEWQAVPTMLMGNELLCLAAFAGNDPYRHVFEANRRLLPWMIDHMPA